MTDFPADDIGHALRGYQKAGRDLSRPATLRFDHCFDAHADAIQMAARVQGDVIATYVTEHEAGGSWAVRCLVVVVPTPEAVADLERRLGRIAEKLGGVTDGWELLPW